MNDVVIGWVHPGKVHTGFLDSLLRTVAYDIAAGGRRIAGWNGVQCSANISSGRNELVKWFLASPAQWLMFIDTDMVWPHDAVHQLLEVGSDSTPIVGGLCFGMEPDTGNVFPTLYDILDGDEPEFIRYDEYPENTLMPVMGTGAAFLLLHRSALETVAAQGYSEAYPWFQERELAGKRIGEDLTLCMRAAGCGIPVHVHTGVQIGHIKEQAIGAATFQAQRAAKEA